MALKSFLDGKIFAEVNITNQHIGYPLIIFLHGWGRSKADFSKFISDYNCVAFDLPGFGSSQDLEKVYDAHVYAEDISNAINELPSDSIRNGIVIVGHSLGGRVAACLGILRVDIVKGIIFIGAPLIRYTSKTKSPLLFRVAKILNRIGVISERKMEENKKKYGSADYRKASGLLRESLVKIINESYQDELKQFKFPVSFLWGINDTAAPFITAYDSEELVSNSLGVQLVDDSSHDVHLENPQSLIDQIDLMMKALVDD
ncbi:MAG: alpha/beta hydrolase [Acidimicrobiia bacterium]|nr:alpha/beta hydrolase [Acidimicrobiia bacterium]